MHRTISYSEDEFYCRYLSLGLSAEPIMKMCSGNFYSFLNNTLALKKLPYDIKVIDLIVENFISVDLFVELPKRYFISWENFPILGHRSKEGWASDIKDAGYFNLRISMENETSLSEFSHPYDEQLSERFKNRFRVSPPFKLKKSVHPNGREFYPNEAYLAYWKAYIILETVNECQFIERYVPENEGTQRFKVEAARINERWMNKYGAIFGAISHYKTFTAQFHLLNKPLVHTYGEISQHLLRRANTSASELNSGLGALLELHKSWTRKLENNGIYSFNFALKSLKRDIYFLFEWLCGLGFKEKELFEQWRNKNRQAKPWSQLEDVLDFEEISFKKTFERYVPIYCHDNSKWFNLDDINGVYEQLNKHKSFELWISSFSDLHKSINMKSDISLIQPRLLDTLLVMTIRTEVLIRTMLLDLSEQQEPNDLKGVLIKLVSFFTDERCKVVLGAVVQNIYLAKLQDRPEAVFINIEKFSIEKNWSNKQKHFFKIILKFIASRNYFAHHYYKDHEFNTHTNSLCGEVLNSCLQTILFINDSRC